MLDIMFDFFFFQRHGAYLKGCSFVCAVHVIYLCVSVYVCVQAYLCIPNFVLSCLSVCAAGLCVHKCVCVCVCVEQQGVLSSVLSPVNGE